MKSQLVPVLLLAALACAGAAEKEPAVVPAPAGESQNVLADAQPVTPDAEPAIPDAKADSAVLVAVVPSAREGMTSEPGPGTERGDPKRDLWHSKAPTSYVVTQCAYGFSPPSCSLQAVKDGHVVASESRFSLQDPWQPSEIELDQDPFDALFAEMQTPPDNCRSSYEIDPVYAYPSQVYLDCGGEGWGTRVTCFKPDTLNLDECRQ